MENKYYVYTYHDDETGKEDAAITEAEDEEGAIAKFKKYYTVVTEEKVEELNLYREGYAQGIMILTSF